MIQFNFETKVTINNSSKIIKWISSVIASENREEGVINYVFCDDDYLHKINLEFLNHDTLTDIISFDYSVGKIIHGDIFISVDRVIENAEIFNNNFDDELHRVIIHGILHYCGYKDKTNQEKEEMTQKEDLFLNKL